MREALLKINRSQCDSFINLAIVLMICNTLTQHHLLENWSGAGWPSRNQLFLAHSMKKLKYLIILDLCEQNLLCEYVIDLQRIAKAIQASILHLSVVDIASL